MFLSIWSRVTKSLHNVRLILLIIFLAGCSSVAILSEDLDALYGKTFITDRRLPADNANAQHFNQQVKPILENRCVVCHGCYDAPCQLKLNSPEGIMRGANPELVYNGTRILASTPNRLGIDATSTEQWRGRGFHTILNERSQTAAINSQNSVMYQMLALKQAYPDASDDDSSLLSDDITLGLDREQQCATRQDFNEFAQQHPLWGMPYALPALNENEHNTLSDWIKNGAPMSLPAELPITIAEQRDQWEQYLNQNSLKQQLASRYIYEHWYLGNLYFSDVPLFTEAEPVHRPEFFFKLVRSATPPGLPIKPIATRRPYDDPAVKRVYYRLQLNPASIVAKNHMPYRLNQARMDWLTALFIDPDYTVEELPSYDTHVAANPFIAFRDLPVGSRYRFMLQEAQYTIMGYIKGPVCRGQVALNVIDDHFWVFFSDPSNEDDEYVAEFLDQQSSNLRLPGEAESNSGIVTNWLKYSYLQGQYLKAKREILKKYSEPTDKFDTSLIWDGEKRNPNAALTVFRHFDSSTVVKGLAGQNPKTAWVITYPLLERIHYLLVAEFDVYGNIGHQLLTRLYMDFLRMEGEFNFLALLPQKHRIELADYWYRDTSEEVKEFLVTHGKQMIRDPDIHYTTDNPKAELFEQLKRRLGAALDEKYSLQQQLQPEQLSIVSSINNVRGITANLMPEMSLLMVDGYLGQQQLFSIIRNSGHSNINGLLTEDDNRLFEEDYLTLVPGVLGSYPGAMYRVSAFRLPDFVADLRTMEDEEDYRRFVDYYGVRRTNSSFWHHSDQVHNAFFKQDPLNAGLLDFNRLENR